MIEETTLISAFEAAPKNTLSALKASADADPCGLVIIDDHKRILYFNREASRLILSCKNFQISDRNTFSVYNQSGHGVLDYFMIKSLESDTGFSSSLDTFDFRLSLEVCCIYQFSNCNIFNIRMYSDSRSAAIHDEKLIQIFGVTKSEAKFLRYIAMGLTVDQLACSLNLTPHTVRTYLKRVYLKMGVRQKSQLVRLLLTFAMR